MKPILLRQKRSGNFEIVKNPSLATIIFRNQSDFVEWFNFHKPKTSRIIKAVFDRHQVYYKNAVEFIRFLKQ